MIIASMSQSLNEMGWTLAALLSCAWLVSLVVRWLAARVRLRRHHRRQRVARRGEIDAVALLERAGFELVGSQVEGLWTVWVDDVPHEVQVFADHLVRTDSGLYVAEVKTGRRAPSVRTARTRRQLLEYLFAFDVDGVLLIDMEERAIHRVEFDV